MSDFRDTKKPLLLNMDKSPKILGETECFFLRNNDIYLNNSGEKRGTLGKSSPFGANYMACEMEQPAGENYTIMKYYSQLTNELYSAVINNNNVHYIQRINGDGTCEVVYTGCLRLNASPRHSIEQFRAYLKVDKLCANRHGKSLIWVDGTDFDIGMIDVEASIATSNFTTPFFELCADPCELIKMCVPDPCGCLPASFIPLSLEDIGKTNFILDKPLMFAYRHVYYDGRGGIWSDPTKPFYQDTKGCFDTSEGFPRCMKLRVPVGNPLVDKIEIAFFKDGGWTKYDTIDKYKKYNSSQQYWYERTLSEEVDNGTFSESDCSFDYTFCGDKECVPIAPTEFNRVFNPMPREPQGFFPIGLSNQKDEALAFFNYKQGSCPIDKFQVDKFDVALDCPTDSCEPEFTKIIAYAVVHNRMHNTNQPIFRLGGSAANDPDDPSDTAYFGGLNQMGAGNQIGDNGLELGHGQNFRDKTRNFIAYVEGTNNWDEAKQFKADPNFLNKEEWGTLAHFNDSFECNRWRRAIANGQFFYQKIEIKVPKGTRGFLRLTSHQSTTGGTSAQDKSTFVIGVLNDITQYRGSISLHSGNTNFETEEIWFDTCNVTGDLEITQAFVIDDNAVDAGLTSAAASFSGYVKDDNGQPVEGAFVEANVGVTQIPALSTTDHNGFWHFYVYAGVNDSVDIDIKVEQDCSAFSTIKTLSLTGAKGAATSQDAEIEDEDWSDSFYATINSLVQDCNGNPVAGMRVAVSGSKYKVTGADGIAVIKVRNYQSRNRTVRLVVLDNGGCLTVDCNNNCNPCLATGSITTPNCFDPMPTMPTLTFTININSTAFNINGLKAGGRYPLGFVVRGSCGRISAVNEIKYLDIPRTQEKMLQNFCSFTYNGNGIVLPSWATCLDIVRGANINPFELQWVVDSIERTDDNKIKITIQSLNDYNKQYFFKTNTVYQWLKGDRIEFIRNGDGKIFDITTHGLLNYLTLSPFHDEAVSGDTEAPADFFNQLIINDDGKLDDLEEGAIIELQRPQECTTEPTYFSICVSIPIVTNSAGEKVLAADTGTFTTFDTYFVNRKIGEFATQRFEHTNPSDFWGDAINPLTDAGRAYFANKYENEQRFGRNMTINSPLEFNRFGDLVKRFDPSTHGDIIAISVTDNKIGMCISEHDWTPFQISDELLRVGNDGMVRAANPDQVVSDSEPKLRGAFGCQYDSIGSIFFGDGFGTWVDVNRGHFVKCDYNEAVAVDIGRCYRYFRRRTQEIETHNRANANPLNKLRFATGQNAASDVVMLTIKALRDSGINNEPAPFLKQNDTILFDPSSNEFLGFHSATPEGFGRLTLFDGNGCAIVMFLNGLPYIVPVIPDRWNEFFGVSCDWYIGIVLNADEKKRKRPLAIEVQSETMFYAKQVNTEKPNFISEIPAIRWKRNGDKWTAAFLSNSASRTGLYGDHKPTGYYFEILLVRDNTDGLKYNTIDNVKRIGYSEIDLINMKYSVMEQSGMTANL